jgi:2',3'-cyclic-nucleotide 2'-phosphodiesterase (5'-nucleotidase family)
MGLWEMVAIIVVAGIIGETIKTYTKRHASRKELIEIRDTLKALQEDIDDMKTNIANIVIQLDDMKKFS